MPKIEFFAILWPKQWIKNKGRPTPLPMKVSVDIVLTQYSVYVWEPIEDFPSDLGVRDNALIPIVLQGTRGKEQSLANLPSCEIDFTFKKRTMSLSHTSHSIRQTFNARDELLLLWCFFIEYFKALRSFLNRYLSASPQMVNSYFSGR